MTTWDDFIALYVAETVFLLRLVIALEDIKIAYEDLSQYCKEMKK